MKRFVGLFALVVMFVIIRIAVFAGDGIKLRVNGLSTAGDNYVMVIDSTEAAARTDSDTLYSDTFKFEEHPSYRDFNYLHMVLIRDTIDISACDSCHDSVVVATTIWTYDNEGYSRQLASDVPAADLTNDTVTLRFYINGNGVVPHPDSTVRDWIWVRTIIRDSVVGFQNPDVPETLKYYARYFLWFSK